MRGVARRYARALVSYSVENGVDLDGMIANLKSVVDFLGKNVDIKRYLLSPIISRSEKLEFAKELFGKLNLPDYLVNFCLLLVEKDRLGIFDLVYEEVVDEVDRRNNRVRGTLK
ncbi:MAG: F0F1 ATP synthase subunit delta, partial [Thermosulfidibacteraceae bacterium]